MKALWLFAMIGALVMWGCGSGESKDIKGTHVISKPTNSVVEFGDYKLGAPISAGNVTVVPVMFAKDVDPKGNEITLAEAKKLGLVEIIEVPGEEQVNKLRVHNKSDRPLLLLGGELLLGGKQDRIVMHDTIIPPGETQEVDVNCVERGRWEGTSQKFYSSDVMVPHSVREAAAYEDQDKVWANVGDYNAAANPTLADTGTTVQIGLNSREVNEKVKAAMPDLAKQLESNPRVIGMIYVLNGEIVSMDVFGNPKTFQASKNGLLSSYLSEGAVAKGESKPMPGSADFRKFLEDIATDRKSATLAASGVVITNGSRLQGNEVTAKADGFGVAGEKAPLVHGTYSKRK